ncbi:MAG: Hpt domain-containing protein [Hespellia sp.]|nr:Hpt domain-containing protein [Hespellia sp.]
MKVDVLEAVGIDVAEGVKRFSGREDLYSKYLFKFAEDQNFQQCREDMKTGDIESAFRHAHALKGITGNLSMNRFYKHLYDVVEALRAGDGEHAKELFVNLEKEYDEVIDAIEASKD